MSASELIEGYLAYLRKQSSADNTIDDRRRILTVLDRDLPYGLEEVNIDELETWLWRDGLSAGSRETYYGAMAGFYRWARAAGYFDFDPTEYITRPKVEQRLPRPVSDDQLIEALERAREPYLTWVKLAAWSGMRCMDIANQPREEITAEVIVIRKSKGLKARAIPTHATIWEAVCDLPPGPGITDRDADYVSQSTANYFSRTMKMPGVSLHRFRHWFGTMVQRKYKDLRVTQDLLGHRNPATTAGYALVAGEQMRGAIDLLPTFDVARAVVPAGRLPRQLLAAAR
jgi:site-specific recombinase XerD